MIGDSFSKTIPAIDRKATDDGVTEYGQEFIRVSDHHVRIGSGDETKLALSETQLKNLKSSYKSEKHSKSWTNAIQSSSVFLRAQNEEQTDFRNPLLLFYPLNLTKEDGSQLFNTIVWGIGIGFPGIMSSSYNRYFEYWLNPVAIRKDMCIEEEGDDEDGEV